MSHRLLSRRLPRVLAVVACLGATFSAVSIGTSSASTAKVANQTITFINCGPELAPVEGGVLLAPELGYLPHVTITAVNSSGTGACVQAVAAGQEDISGPGLEPVLDAVASGEKLNVKFFYETVRHEPFEIGVASGSSLKADTELKGLVIGVPTIGGIEQDYASEILQSANVSPSSVHFEAVGSGAAAIADLSNGTISALCVEDNIWGQFKGLGDSFKILPLPTTGHIAQIPGSSIVANGSWLNHHKALATAYAIGVTKALLFQFANPGAMAAVFFKAYPQYLIPGKTLEQNIQAVLPEFASEGEAVWGYNDTHPLKNWGQFTTEQWRALLQVDRTTDPSVDSLTAKDLAPYWTNEIAAAIPHINVAAIVKQALAYKIS
jgi:NitT/TauT family transport system substrate-binding protein